MNLAQLRAVRPLAWLLAAPLVLVLLMLGGRAPLARAGDNYDPALAVRQDLGAKGYNVINVGLVDDDPGQPGVVMTMVSEQLDAKVTAQLQDGWTSLNTFYKAPVTLHDYLAYHNRYWLVWSISAADWNAWLKGTLPSDDFWSHVAFGVYDTVTGQAVEGKSFLDKNFTDLNPPGPQQPVDPSSVPGAGVLLDASSAFVPITADGGTATLLARLSDAGGNRLPGQPVTFTVASGVGNIDPPRANGDDVGTARATYSPAITAITAVSGTTGLPVQITAYGSAGPGSAASLKLLLNTPAGASVDLAKERTIQAMQLQGYKVLGVDYQSEIYPVGNVTFIYAGPQMEAASAQLDAALFHQIKLGLGTARVAFQNITNPVVTVRLPYGKNVYDILTYVNASDWDDWAAGKIDEVEFWGRASFQLLDDNTGQPVQSIDYTCKDFGAGCDQPHRSELLLSASASVSEQPYGVQHSYGKIVIPAGDTAGNFKPELDGTVSEWRIYQAPNFTGDPLYTSLGDEDGARLADLTLGPGQYVIAVYTDSPPATLLLHYTEFVSY